MANILIRLLVPSLLEVEISITLALVLIAILFLLENSNNNKKKNSPPLNPTREIVPLDEKIQRNFSIEEPQETSYVVKLEILAAKYLIGANLNGTSEPYAIIKCGEQKRFSSLVPSSRNPLWGEEFLFFVNSLPVQIHLTIYDWDTVCKCKLLGSVVLPVAKAGQSGAIWHEFDTKSGQVCLQVSSFRLSNSNSLLTDLAGVKSRKNMLSEKKNPTVAHYQPGPLQVIFRLPFDEDVYHSYSCAIENSFLYHGRMYISAWHLCFHSKFFYKQLKVIIPFEDIDEIKRTQHSFVNPAISIILHAGANGLGAPPLCNRNGRVRYKFTSFWNRNQSFRALQDTLTRYRAMLQAEKKVKMHSLTNIDQLTRVVKRDEEKGTREKFFQPFINQEILVDSVDGTFPCTAEQFFSMFLSDNSNFLMEHRYSRNGTDLKINNWSPSEEHGGQIRKFTFKSPCNSPLCPPYTAVTELQHTTLSADKGTLLYETVQQAHDVPFGSYFEIHCRWCLRTKSESSCQMVIKIGVHMKKWCIIQSKIKSGATEEYKKEVNQILEEARAHLLKQDDSEKGFARGSENHEMYQNQ
ncbi:C2 domain-containing protein / GRAM domain-containing protein [Rhynchospora pubera]|uniref:C2 domain-containing protein / GRAM domain-containing protein n=1 Tax=Rhynchospora pubera TaxID=906938 RepID=A0AAV8HGJ5_9POAL|nr:C2 domain-containing protein / GRAM domain-containing protein [Rhynchospora pubera]